MKLLILSPYFPPEVGAPQSRLFELAVRLVRRGHDVTVLTGFPNYPNGIIPPSYRGKFRMEEEMQGVRVVRTWIYATPNRGFIKRILNHLSFMVSGAWTGMWLPRHDLILVESPPLFDGLAGAFLAAIKRSRMLFYVADLWPQSAIEMGMLRHPLLVKVAEAIERFIYRRSERILAVTFGIERALRDGGFDHVFFLPNGVDTSMFAPGTSGSAMRERLGVADRFIVLYAGTLGLQQRLETVIEAARLMEAKGLPVTFLLVGDGAEREHLVAAGQGVSTLRILESMPKSDIPELVAACDAYVVILRDLPVFRGARPSKLFEPMAAGKPVVLSVRGEAERLIEEADAGLTVAPEDPAALAGAVERLMHDPGLCRRLGENGRRYVVEHLDRQQIVDRFEALASEILQPVKVLPGPL